MISALLSIVAVVEQALIIHSPHVSRTIDPSAKTTFSRELVLSHPMKYCPDTYNLPSHPPSFKKSFIWHGIHNRVNITTTCTNSVQ